MPACRLPEPGKQIVSAWCLDFSTFDPDEVVDLDLGTQTGAKQGIRAWPWRKGAESREVRDVPRVLSLGQFENERERVTQFRLRSENRPDGF